MSKALEVTGPYMDIVQTVGRWKVLDVASLEKLCNYKFSYFNLLDKVRKLERAGFVKSVFVGRKHKHIFLTDQGIKLTSEDCSSEISLENLNHDILTGRFVQKLLQYEVFKDGKLFHQILDTDVYPDAEVKGVKKDHEYNLAIEIELTQKEKGRVKNKFVRYKKSPRYDFVLFVMHKESVFRAYNHYLEQMSDEVKQKIIFLMNPKFERATWEIEKSSCYYLGKEYSFNEFFIS